MSTSNTLIVYDAENDKLATIAESLAANRSQNHLAQVTHLKSFGRVLAVFSSCQAAVAAMSAIRYAHPEAAVSFGGFTDLHAQPRYLKLPDAGTLWFTSPPLSPCDTWEQGVEDEPNAQTHFDAEFTNTLAKALEKVRDTGPVAHPADESCSCTIYQSPTDSLPNIKIDWENCEAPKLATQKNLPHTTMPGVSPAS